ncbi:DNA topoisomerase III [Ligilactobacillus sp. WILCCON 0076]|uniref:DNA topoisomerase n=1 Tax=Ligilactobacillus ubinensis TaxID=2876789 RepID=A0A9X2JLF3_9LACO|nr:DNA topoisomerase III [Ligilactobacillus ubinensis]MCP0886859.1 DNA topoisomerase III [Ligilactobacillus ubinensis]
MKQLILAEKPSVARDLAHILGATQKNKNYFEGSKVIVTWALGHLLTLKMPEDLDQNWQQWQMETLPMIPKYIGIKPLPKTRAQLKTIGQLAKRKDISEAVIATDAGREGELVARWILEYVRFNKPVKRLWISSQTTKAVKAGFANLKSAKEYDNLYYSALARSKADWLVGLNVTRALTVKYQDSLSAGRVQTPTVALVNKQDEKIAHFIPQKYYIITLQAKGQKIKLQQKNPYELKTREAAQKLVTQLQNNHGIVSSISVKEKTESAPLPYDLTELQREANARYGFSAKRTLSLIQSLYEIHKIVSYPRTDSKYLSNDIRATLKERLQAVCDMYPEAKEYAKNGAKVVQNRVFNDGKVTDHYALIPTEQKPNYAKLSSDEHRIYGLIVARFLGLFAKAHKVSQQKVTIKFGQASFILNQNTVLEQGWKRIDQKAKLDKIEKWVEGQRVEPNFSISEALTTPPAHLNEGTLLAQMEKYGLGTPATRAEIIEKLIKSNLMERKNNYVQMTPKGKQLLGLVNPQLVTPELTAKWEKQLESIAAGKYASKQFLKEIENDTRNLVKEIKNSQEKYQDFSLTQKKCPECGSLLREKNARDGKLYVCSNTECKYRRRAEAKVSNHRCPQCHRKMLIVAGKNGDYFRCKYDGTTDKMADKKKRSKKMTKYEEKKLLKKVNQDNEPQESALAEALKVAMSKNN